MAKEEGAETGDAGPQRENKYFLLKQDDLDWFAYRFVGEGREYRYLSQVPIGVLTNRITDHRVGQGKPPLSENNYIVCNQDESYADKVWEVILAGEAEKKVVGK